MDEKQKALPMSVKERIVKLKKEIPARAGTLHALFREVVDLVEATLPAEKPAEPAKPVTQ